MRNFEHTPYLDPQNGQTYHSYRMTRAGFSMLAMGFTGGRAFTFKVRYIEAFDAMGAELARRPAFDFLRDPKNGGRRAPKRGGSLATRLAAPLHQFTHEWEKVLAPNRQIGPDGAAAGAGG